jgi:hypothetical protein
MRRVDPPHRDSDREVDLAARGAKLWDQKEKESNSFNFFAFWQFAT